MIYKFKEPIIAYFKCRKKRFFAYFDFNGVEVVAHCLNTGKMAGTLKVGAKCILSKKDKGLPYVWEAVEIDNTWIGINTSVPNYLTSNLLKTLFPQEVFLPEKKIDKFKPDFLSENYLIEVKNVHWKIKDKAYFPDTPTIRGYNQVNFFKTLKYKFILIYIIQRNDVFKFSIADFIQPELKEVTKNVKSLAFNCNVNLDGISIYKECVYEE